MVLLNFCGKQNRHHEEENHAVVNHSHPSGEQTIHLTEAVEKQINVKTAPVKPGPVKSTLKAMGHVLCPNDQKAIIGFAFSARIVKLHTAVGQWVEKGHPLVTLECEEMGNAQSAYVQALTDYELSKLDFDREERLFKKDIGAKKEYLGTKAKYQVSLAALKAAEKKLAVMGLSKKQIDEISKTKNVTPRVTLNSPIAGRVVKNEAVPGAVIDASTGIMVVMDLGCLWIDAEIYEKDLSKVKKGQDVEIVVPAYPKEHFHGQIHYIGDVVNSETRTITVRTQVDNKDFRLKPGMFADINIMTDHKEEALIIPKEALLDDGDKKIVFVHEHDHYTLRTVEIGARYNGDVEIIQGLKLGELVVVEGNYQLKSRLQQDLISHGHTH
jgi:cobalt-zinc-cadmium efflux system membrane fusion protein